MRRSVSPLDKDRPKKRIQEDNDIFDIDRFIFLNQDSSINQEDMVEDFVTPDLNVNVVSAGVIHEVSDYVEVSELNVVEKEAITRQEVVDTVEFAKNLGGGKH
ncbi:hypothetical protein Hanom_Chr16g01506451 [Helianthus anomalus]